MALIAESQRYVFTFIKNVYIREMLTNRHLKFAKGIQGIVEYNTATCVSAATIIIKTKIILCFVIKFVIYLIPSLQVFLNTYGIQTQTPQQVEPIQIWAQKELVKVRNSALKIIYLSRNFFCNNRNLYQAIRLVSP